MAMSCACLLTARALRCGGSAFSAGAGVTSAMMPAPESGMPSTWPRTRPRKAKLVAAGAIALPGHQVEARTSQPVHRQIFERMTNRNDPQQLTAEVRARVARISAYSNCSARLQG